MENGGQFYKTYGWRINRRILRRFGLNQPDYADIQWVSKGLLVTKKSPLRASGRHKVKWFVILV